MVKWSALALTVAFVGGSYFLLSDTQRTAEACGMSPARLEGLLQDSGKLAAVAHVECLASGANALRQQLEARAER